jgi:hypothetical protein
MGIIGETIDINSLNAFAVNKKARAMLKAVAEEPDETCLYCVQLVLWAAKRGCFGVEGSVRETLEAMAAWSPERIANFLELDASGFEYEPPGWQAAETPEDLARVVLDELENRMMALFPWYRHLE